jgi:predicted MPP superfamily phosphohydrolase
MRFLGRAALVAAALGAYSLYEPYRYRLVTHRLETPPGGPALKILHLSDLHLKGRDHKLAAFVRGLDSVEDLDLVLATGDFIEDNSGIEPLIGCFSGLTARYGCYYVLGSHDYHQSRFTSYSKYFKPKTTPVLAPRAATDQLEAGLRKHGWQALTNRSVVVDTAWGRLRLTGMDDPYLGRHDQSVIHRDTDDSFAIGLLHSPEVISAWFREGFDLVVAGHTHAGQVRVPFYGALVTNCSLPTALAGGAHRVDGGWLHVSPGLGTGKFSPIRFNCLPEATILQISPRA